MHCPFCSENDTKVIDSRLVADGHQVRRRRQCLACSERFTTFESAELAMPKVVKSNGNREPFDEEKMVGGLQRALEKRPVSADSVDVAISMIKSRLRATGEREVPSDMIGNFVDRFSPILLTIGRVVEIIGHDLEDNMVIYVCKQNQKLVLADLKI